MHGVACGRRGTRRLVGLAQLLPLLLSRTCWSERVADCMQLAIEERHLQMHTSCVFAWLQAGAAAAQGVRAAPRPAWTDDPFDCTAYPPTGCALYRHVTHCCFVLPCIFQLASGFVVGLTAGPRPRPLSDLVTWGPGVMLVGDQQRHRRLYPLTSIHALSTASRYHNHAGGEAGRALLLRRS